MRFLRISFFIASLGTGSLLAAPTPIELSHRLNEASSERFSQMIEKFNKSQNEVAITLVRKAESEPPRHLALVNAEEYERYLARKTRFRPLGDLLREAKVAVEVAHILPELRSAQEGKNLFALPIAFSTPVLYYNKAAFRKAGLDPELPPKTWAQMQIAAGKLRNSGLSCAYTTSWPAWVMVDNFSSWHGIPVSDARKNLSFNALLQIKHIAMMASWHKTTYFTYFDRRDEADRRFALGECGMLTSTSALQHELNGEKDLDFGVSTLPYHDDEIAAPKNTLADGASLWLVAGLKPAENRAAAKFISFLLEPNTQLELTLSDGFLPLSTAAYAAAQSQLLKNDTAALRTAFAQLRNKPVSTVLRVSQNERLRIVVEEELEAVWAGKKPAKQALDDAVMRGNVVLRPQAAAPSKKGKK